jgi:DNA-binding GntR family transcriptional regulator
MPPDDQGDHPQRGPLLSRQVLSDTVYEAVKERIMNLTIPPDVRINMDELARELGVSNTPLREALSRLETEGLVTRKQLHGYRTTGLLGERELRELYFVRLLLEPAAAREAALHAEPHALEASLGKALGQMMELAHLPKLDRGYHTYRAFAEADARFHQAIALASGNQLVASMLTALHAHGHAYRLYFRAGMAPETVNEHLQILDALLDQNPDVAASSMQAHLEASRDRFLPIVKDE